MKIQEVIEVVNQMQINGVVESYAIGGAVGATFYIEAVSTLDVDVFVTLKVPSDSLLLSLRPIFEYLTARGGKIEGEYVVFSGWPIQFLPPINDLVEEALREAVTMDVDGIPARVFSAEHLAAIALQTGRGKDKARLNLFIEAKALNLARFERLVEQHGLSPLWEKFKTQFLED